MLKLPFAHSLTIGSAPELTISHYWTLEPPPPLRLDSDEAYAAAFLEIFTEAVRSRLRSAGPVGSMLSGGMDSGSVTAIAAELLGGQGNGPLPTFSAVGPDPVTCIETRTIRIAAESIAGLDPHFINYADLQPYRSDLIRLWDGSHPFDSHMTLIRALYLAANRPKSVLWRRGKEHLGWNFTQSLITGWDRWPNVFERETARGHPSVVVPIWLNEPNATKLETKITLLSFLRWMRHHR